MTLKYTPDNRYWLLHFTVGKTTMYTQKVDVHSHRAAHIEVIWSVKWKKTLPLFKYLRIFWLTDFFMFLSLILFVTFKDKWWKCSLLWIHSPGSRLLILFLQLLKAHMLIEMLCRSLGLKKISVFSKCDWKLTSQCCSSRGPLWGKNTGTVGQIGCTTG